MQQIQDRLVSHLKEKYNPVAIVLHGSRANGMAREHSDWDFVLFVNQEGKIIGREIVEDANIEVKQILLPIAGDKFLGFYFRPENVNILYDPESVAQKILQSNNEIVKRGNQFNEVDKASRHAFLRSALEGMLDYASDPLVLFDKKLDFYSRIIPTWFRFIKREFEPSHYYAYPQIQKEDPEFYALIQEFVQATDGADLVSLGNRMLNLLFK